MMKSIFRVNKRGLLILIAVVCISLVVVGGTAAYMTNTTQQQTNRFHTGVANIVISEPGGSNYQLDSNDTVSKAVTIQNRDLANVSAVPVYVRARLVPILRHGDGTGTGEQIADKVSYTIDSNWIKVGDYYYYKQILYPGSSHDISLMTKATVAGGIPTGDQLEIQVIADSVQTAANAEQNAWQMRFNNGNWTVAAP